MKKSMLLIVVLIFVSLSYKVYADEGYIEITVNVPEEFSNNVIINLIEKETDKNALFTATKDSEYIIRQKIEEGVYCLDFVNIISTEQSKYTIDTIENEEIYIEKDKVTDYYILIKAIETDKKENKIMTLLTGESSSNEGSESHLVNEEEKSSLKVGNSGIITIMMVIVLSVLYLTIKIKGRLLKNER